MATKKRRKAPSKKARRGGRNKNVISVDFTDVESGGGMPTPDGYYIAEIAKAEQDVSSQGNDMIKVVWKTHIGSRVYDNFSLLPQSLWVLRGALECMGYDVPSDEYPIDVDALIGEKCGIQILNEEFEEKDQPKVDGYLTVEAVEEQLGGSPTADEEEEGGEEEEEGEEEEAPKASKKKSKKKAASKKKAGRKAPLRPGARVTFEDEDGEEYDGVIEGIEDDIAVVVDDEEGEWEIPVAELKKA